MRHVLVTGANKGIGFSIAEGVLTEHADTVVLLGSRDALLGEQARTRLTGGEAALEERVVVVPVDVGSDESVGKALAQLKAVLGGAPLYGLVNNAGIGMGDHGLMAMLNVNVVGVHRMSEGCEPLLDPEGGRIVNVTSASAVNFVADCSAERQKFFLDANTEWSDLEALMGQSQRIEGNNNAFAALGLGGANGYGLSKACANAYTLQLAQRFPKLIINSCTPGFIATDMTKGFAADQGRSPAEMGMKSPAEGARSALHLLFGEVGSGHYYGSDCQRSPMDRYRAPGSAPFAG